VLIGLDRDGDDVALSVADDGIGFDPAGAPAGSGLANLVARLTVLGGTVEIRSVPGAGTRLACRVPLTRELAGVDA